jgi:hypothetical protein
MMNRPFIMILIVLLTAAMPLPTCFPARNFI